MTAYNRYTINVGLVNTAGNISSAAARAALADAGIKVVTSNVLRSDTEPTLIALVDIACGSLSSAINHVCDALEQDCIAVVNEKLDDGILVGPNAAAWGTFNPEFFLTLSGRRLSDVRAAGRKLAPKDAYQGHLPGSGVQAHSAGGLFPWVIVAKQVGDRIRYGFLAPDGETTGYLYTYDAACWMALRHKEGQPARDALKVKHEAYRKGAEAAKAAARVEAPQVFPSAKVSLYDIPVELPHGIAALLVAANATGEAISSVYATSHEEAEKLVRLNGFTPLRYLQVAAQCAQTLPDADIAEEPIVEDGARCLLCDHPIPDVPEHKNSHWFGKRDFPRFDLDDLAAQLARIDALRRY